MRDETCMIRWVQLVLKENLRVNPPPPGIVPVLILDAYRCHVMASVVKQIQKLGIEVIQFPGGCTGFYKPLDVGINKFFKFRALMRYKEWMINGIEANRIMVSPSQ